jgi:hypothetical protein
MIQHICDSDTLFNTPRPPAFAELFKGFDDAAWEKITPPLGCSISHKRPVISNQ